MTADELRAKLPQCFSDANVEVRRVAVSEVTTTVSKVTNLERFVLDRLGVSFDLMGVVVGRSGDGRELVLLGDGRLLWRG